VAEDSGRSRRWALRSDPRSAVRTAVLWEALDALVVKHTELVGRSTLDVVDLGGGTGGLAVPLAQRGHRVQVVDPSPDALAALQRRADEAAVADRVRAEQGDASTVADLLGAGVADLVLAHGVLEYVDDPAAAARGALTVLRPGGLASLLVAQRLGGVLARALSGRFAEARRMLDDPDGRGSDEDPLPRRFDAAAVLDLVRAAAPGELDVRLVQGVRLFTDLLPGALVDGDPDAAEALLALERAAGDHPGHRELVALASHLHVVVQTAAS
jgi:S-adenosylmethionine-dependent methyltransferase